MEQKSDLKIAQNNAQKSLEKLKGTIPNLEQLHKFIEEQVAVCGEYNTLNAPFSQPALFKVQELIRVFENQDLIIDNIQMAIDNYILLKNARTDRPKED